jgi:hypothetical protein
MTQTPPVAAAVSDLTTGGKEERIFTETPNIHSMG